MSGIDINRIDSALENFVFDQPLETYDPRAARSHRNLNKVRLFERTFCDLAVSENFIPEKLINRTVKTLSQRYRYLLLSQQDKCIQALAASLQVSLQPALLEHISSKKSPDAFVEELDRLIQHNPLERAKKYLNEFRLSHESRTYWCPNRQEFEKLLKFMERALNIVSVNSGRVVGPKLIEICGETEFNGLFWGVMSVHVAFPTTNVSKLFNSLYPPNEFCQSDVRTLLGDAHLFAPLTFRTSSLSKISHTKCKTPLRQLIRRCTRLALHHLLTTRLQHYMYWEAVNILPNPGFNNPQFAKNFQLLNQLVVCSGTAEFEDLVPVYQTLVKVPEVVLEGLKEAGVKIFVCRYAITQQCKDLRGVQPRGWSGGSTWEDVDGAHIPNKKWVVIATKDSAGGGRGERTSLHELGHALDFLGYNTDNGRSYTPSTASTAFFFAYLDDFSKLAPYFKQDGDAGKQEAFAESFKLSREGNEDWPNLSRYWKIKNIILESFASGSELLQNLTPERASLVEVPLDLFLEGITDRDRILERLGKKPILPAQPVELDTVKSQNPNYCKWLLPVITVVAVATGILVENFD